MGQIEIARFDDVCEADLAAAFLRAEGIDAEVADRNLATIDPLMQRALGGLRVMTPADQAEDARALLSRANAGDYAEDETEDGAAPAHGGPAVTAAVLAALFFTGGQGAYAATGLKGGFSPARLWGFIVIGSIVGGSLLVLMLLWITGNWSPVF